MMNVARRTGAVIVAGLLAGCGPEKSAETEGETASSSSGGTPMSTTGGAPTTTAGTASGTGSGGASEGSGSTSAQGGCNLEQQDAAEKTCAALTDRASCNGAPLDPAVGSCMWVAWFQTRLVDGTCSFGPPRGECQFVRCETEGCMGYDTCGTSELGGAYRVGMDNDVSIAIARWCSLPPAPAMVCKFNGDQVTEGAPECACLCDPSFPVAP